MEYSIRELSDIAGISTRTLRYYDKIGLLKPLNVRKSGYRYYGESEVALLQQILFYKERGLKLEQISEILYGGNFDVMSALSEHLIELEKEQTRVNHMITAVKKTMSAMRGEIVMSNTEKFEAFKKGMIQENEKTYGEEIREKYGDDTVNASNRKMLNMSEEEYETFQGLAEEIASTLEQAVQDGASADDEIGKKAVELHKNWLSMTWPQYNKEAHKNLTEMYVADERFTKYYDGKVKGCAEFLRDAAACWVDKI